MAIDAKQRVKTWWTTTARQYRPQGADELQQEMNATRNRLYNRFKELPDGGELAAFLTALTEREFAFAYYWGFRRGYIVAQALSKLAHSSAQGNVEARIADLCLKHPDWTTKQIFAALDDEGIPLVFLGGLHKNETKKKRDWRPNYWSDVAGDGAYKMLVSRLRDKLRNESRLEGWEKIMKQHTKLRKQEK